jgi:hypothetical protein
MSLMSIGRRSVMGFVWRLVACLAVLGVVYLLAFSHPKAASKRPVTDKQKLADIRAAVDETFIAAQQLNSFKVDDSTAFDQLNSQINGFRQALNHLKQSINTAPPSLPQQSRSTIADLIKRDQTAIDVYAKLYPNQSQVLQYNPANDLPALSATTNKLVSERAAAAQKGLAKAATQSPSPEIKQALKVEADCFDKLSKDLSSQQLSSTTLTRQQCINDYPALRLKVIQSLLQPAWGGDYAAYAKQTVPPLLNRLDGLVKAQS